MKVKVKSIILFFIFSVSFFSIMGFVTMTHNGLHLPEGGDFEDFTINQAETLIEAQSLI
jgi:hypothetical protein